MEIKVLGPGCYSCQALASRVELAIEQLDIEATVKRVHDYQEYTTYGILFTPGLVIDGKLVSAGRVPTVKQIITLLNAILSPTGIEPDFEARQRPTVMAVFKVLPGTNCRQCGQPTCWNFALKLAASQVTLEQCPPLFEPAFADRLAQLQAMVVPMPAIGSAN